MISVAGMFKRYGSTVAVEDVSFSIGPGEVVGFLGPNGAGKTTTMRVLTGYFAPSAGSVAIAGHDVVEEPLAARAQLGYLPEEPPLYPEMHVIPYLRFCARLRGVPRALLTERVGDVIDFDEHSGDVPRKAIGGDRQLHIARLAVPAKELAVLPHNGVAGPHRGRHQLVHAIQRLAHDEFGQL